MTSLGGAQTVYLLIKGSCSQLTSYALLLALRLENICLFWKVSGLERGGRRNRILQATLKPPWCLLPFVLGPSKSVVCCGLNLENCQQSNEGGQVGYCREGLLSCNSERQSINLIEFSPLALCSQLLSSIQTTWSSRRCADFLSAAQTWSITL